MKLWLILVSLAVLLGISPIKPRLWLVQEEGIQRYPVSQYNEWSFIEPHMPASIDFGKATDCIRYSEEKVSIVDCQEGSHLIYWQSPETWKVTEAISADLNRDGEKELVLVVWRPHQTWPIDSFLPSGGRIEDFHDRNGFSCHLILVGWDGDVYRELWAGSSLIDPIFNIRAVDLDNDGMQELAALEGKYDTRNVTGSLTVWDWNGFGFRLRARQPEDHSEFGIISVDQSVMIVSD